VSAPILPASGGGPDASRLRVAWLVYRGNPYSGGQGVYTRYMARELVEMGHSVDVLAGQPWPLLDPGARLVKIPSLDLFRADDPWHIPRPKELRGREHLGIDAFEFGHMCTSGFPEPWTFSLRARRYFLQHGHEYDLVHDNQCFGYGIRQMQEDGMAIAATLHHPITVDRDLENEEAERQKAGLKRRFSLWRWYGFLGMQIEVARSIPRIVTVSENSKKDIVTQMKVPVEQLHVVPVGVDHQRFKPLAHVERKPHMLLTAASADVPLKGLRPLLEAVAKVKAQRPVEITIIGKKREGSVLPQLLDRLGLNDIVTFVSGISDERLVELYNEATVAVVPSLYEGFSLPAIEFMACGTPLITTTGGALPEVVGTDGLAAITVPPNDPDALAEAIKRMLDDPALRERMGEGGRARVLNRFTWKVAAEGTVEQWRLLLDDRARAKRDGLPMPGTRADLQRSEGSGPWGRWSGRGRRSLGEVPGITKVPVLGNALSGARKEAL
jgi:glycosyltransferase involved in cell wall biosynthesis